MRSLAMFVMLALMWILNSSIRRVSGSVDETVMGMSCCGLGAGRVAFSGQQSYITAISSRFVQLQIGDIDKRVSSCVLMFMMFVLGTRGL